MKKAKTIIRWLCVLPAAVIGACLGYFAAFIFSWLTSNYLMHRSLLDDIWLYVVSAFFVGFCFVYSGHYVAPMHKKHTSLVLCIILSMVCGFLIISNFFIIGMSWDFFKIIVFNLTSVGSSFYAYSQLKEDV